ncbi:hypothetical protein [Neotamlana laminarinivorans]|uniref:Uncharacterized protein n=1 Tax=Neotamlana laminarinivorans TaxID=2883124 RepID=A0A9X1HZ09_9FLAO|nr:hypothetical protein [Tamlana laminarinivorans]MCB4798505.1 hypothetical protein [Tamlana laminarinivorans]
MKKLKIWTMILHSLIVIIHKNTISIMLFIEFFTLDRWLNSNGFSDSFSKLILIASITSVIGNLLIIISLLVKKVITKNLIGILGIILLYVSFRYLTYPSLNYTDFHKWAFWSGIPFTIASIFLFHEQYIELKTRFKSKPEI